MPRGLLVALFALALLSVAPSAQAQYCWDTICAAGTPAADCWRAWCPTTTYQAPTYSTWSYPTYSAPAPTYNPYADTSRIQLDILPTTQAGWCARSYARGDHLASTVWHC